MFDDPFWELVDRSGGPEACWPFTGGLTQKGYGDYRGGGTRRANRRALEEFLGRPLADDEWALHGCDNPPCCNPYPGHLYVGTPKQNQDDRRARTGGNEGSRHGMAKLTEVDVLAIRSATDSQYVLAERFGITQPQVSRIRSRKVWAHL